MTERVTTSIKIDPELWKKAKIAAIERGIDVSELVERALEKYVCELEECSRDTGDK